MTLQSPGGIIQAPILFRFSFRVGGDSSKISLEANLWRVLQESWWGFAIFRYFESLVLMPYTSSTSLSVTTPSSL